MAHHLDYDWEKSLNVAIFEMLHSTPYIGTIPSEHVKGTPERVVKAFKEYFGGCAVDPLELLSAKFEASPQSQMIHVKDIPFYSMCAHHLVPFFGKVYFAYVPDKHIVGLSKIPRMISALSRRPQVQERLADQIVDTFMEGLKPKGCAVLIRGYHFCMLSRGVKAESSYTTNTSLRGVFFTDHSTKAEFLQEASIYPKVWG